MTKFVTVLAVVIAIRLFLETFIYESYRLVAGVFGRLFAEIFSLI